MGQCHGYNHQSNIWGEHLICKYWQRAEKNRLFSKCVWGCCWSEGGDIDVPCPPPFDTHDQISGMVIILNEKQGYFTFNNKDLLKPLGCKAEKF